ncbi:hypothetical protein EPUS_04998 [Neofusicoccum parvum]|nr:hypothetical protein EPUS_04998 [Neofusicoccum parvum]
MAEPFSSLSGVGAAGAIINSSVSVTQKLFELKAVGDQTRDLLETSEQINTTLEYARTLRRRKSKILSTFEKRWIDGVLDTTEKAVRSVASLIEPARVDIKTKGRISLATRGLFVLRDSPNVSASLARLGIASQSLNTAMGTLCSRDGSAYQAQSYQPPAETKPAPPSYEESQGPGLRPRRRESGIPAKPELGVDASVGTSRWSMYREEPQIPAYPVGLGGGGAQSPVHRREPMSPGYREELKTPLYPDELKTPPYPTTSPFPFPERPRAAPYPETFPFPDVTAQFNSQVHRTPFPGADGLQVCKTPQLVQSPMDLTEAMDGLHVCSDWEPVERCQTPTELEFQLASPQSPPPSDSYSLGRTPTQLEFGAPGPQSPLTSDSYGLGRTNTTASTATEASSSLGQGRSRRRAWLVQRAGG